MLQQTFIHIPGVGRKTESKLWENNIQHWQDVKKKRLPVGPATKEKIQTHIEKSERAIHRSDTSYFVSNLKGKHHWRAKDTFTDIAYLDIETTGLTPYVDYVTVVGVHTATETKLFVKGQNLEAFGPYMTQFTHLVTFNGRRFDMPFLERDLNWVWDGLHTDLYYVCKGVGLNGGLKQIEKKIGIGRDAGVDGLSGADAVRLWHEWEQGDRDALEKLLHYCEHDIKNLSPLFDHTYNLRKKKLLKGTPIQL